MYVKAHKQWKPHLVIISRKTSPAGCRLLKSFEVNHNKSRKILESSISKIFRPIQFVFISALIILPQVLDELLLAGELQKTSHHLVIKNVCDGIILENILCSWF